MIIWRFPVNTEELLDPLLTKEDPNSLSEELTLVADSYFYTNNFNAGQSTLFGTSEVLSLHFNVWFLAFIKLGPLLVLI